MSEWSEGALNPGEGREAFLPEWPRAASQEEPTEVRTPLSGIEVRPQAGASLIELRVKAEGVRITVELTERQAKKLGALLDQATQEEA